MKEIPPFRLRPEPLSEDAANLPKFEWASQEVGTRHQLGGRPSFLQRAEWPNCSDCGGPMTFYGQLDSINDEFIIADCGMVYIFVCLKCNEAKSIIQSS